MSVIRRAEPASSTSLATRDARAAPRPAARRPRARGSSTIRAGRSPAPSNRSVGEDRLLGLRAEALELADLAAPRRRSRSDSSESIPSSSYSRRARLGPSPGRRVISISPGGNLRAQLDERRDRAVVGEREDLLLDRSRRPRELGGAALARERRHRHGRLADRLGGVPVRDDPVDRGAVELVQVAELVEGGGDLGVRRDPTSLRYVALPVARGSDR